jgi:histidinol-phosphatase
MSAYMQAAAELAGIAGANAMKYFRGTLETELKGDGSPVTNADRSSERLAREWIQKRFPSDGILGEEYGVINPDAKRRWILDPIDGTKAFTLQVPFWGSLVAVVEGDTVVAGAASFPAIGESLAAAPGEGCWWNGGICRVSPRANLAEATVLTTDGAFKEEPEKLRGWLALSAAAGTSRTWGDCVGYLLVATGRAEVMADPRVAAWDIAPFVPAIAEAGGVFTDWRGESSFSNGSAVATNAELAIESRRILNLGPVHDVSS